MSNEFVNHSSTGRGGASRLLVKLTTAIEANKFYEAHQLLKTIYFRYMSLQKYEELEEYLQNYSILFLDNNQIESGADLAILLSNLYSTANIPISVPRINFAIRILEKIPICPERQKFVHSILEWGGNSPLTGPFYSSLAMKLITEKNYHDAWKNIIRVTDPDDAIKLILHVIQENRLRPQEIDLIISSYVVRLLCSRRVEQADKCYKGLVKLEITELTPLMNGTRFLVESAKTKNPKAFLTIKEIYSPSFDRDIQLRKLVIKAGKSLFNFQDRRDQSGGNSFMPMLMNAFLNPGENSFD